MVCPSLLQTALTAIRQIEPVIVLEQLGSTFADTALQMVVKDRSVNATYPDMHLSREESEQKAMSDFYMTYTLIIQLTPIVPSLILARLGDRGWRRLPIVVPLTGYLLSKLMLLLVVIFQLPLEVMFGAAVLFGLSGGYCTLWPGVMTLVSLRSTAAERSKVIMRVELLYGMAGLVGSLLSGHLFQLYTSNLRHGTILLIVSTLLHLFSLIDAMVLLQIKKKEPSQEPEDESHPMAKASGRGNVETPTQRNLGNVVLLISAAVLYGSAVAGGVDILNVFVMKAPLSWTATQVGYGNAAGCAIFFTSFLGVIVFRRCVGDVALILIGMLSFALGIFFMSFVTTTSMFYLVRSLTLFGLIPMPTIRALLSQQVPASSCGVTLTSLQLSLKFAGLAYLPAYTKIYQRTLSWFPGFVFLLSSILTVLAMIPVSIVGCRAPQRQQYERIQEE
ncbi:uncharacterized protein V6R79_022695 [Siganus canaliculatus]